MPRSIQAIALILAISGRLSAQHVHDHAAPAGSASTAPTKKSGAADWKMEAMARHMAYSASRPLTAADSARAAHVIHELRQAVAKYQDVKVAEADGYKMFAPQIGNQPQYHFTRNRNAIRNSFGFDAARPTSLLYKRNSRGELVLTGAMYTRSSDRQA